MDSEVDLVKKNKFPFLTFLGINPYEVGFVQTSLTHIKESDLDCESLTNGFVLELWSLVEPDKSVNSEKSVKADESLHHSITRRQFAEIVGCVVLRECQQGIH